MNEHQLHHMYQSWSQGNDNPRRDWSLFVEWAARWNKTTGDKVIAILQTTRWFQWPGNDR